MRCLIRSFVLLAALVGIALPADAQPALLDSLRPLVERAVARSEWASLDGAIARLRTATAGPAARDAWTHYDLGYVLHRRASAYLVARQVDRAKPLLDESERALARAQQLGGGMAALGLRGAVTGQLAGTGGAFTGMRMGPRSFKQLDEAVAGAPRDPRVALANGMTRLNAPRAFGGGPAKAEPELRRAIKLFEQDRPTGGEPAWGRVDAHIWLAIALEQQGRRDEARVELQRALTLAPGHAWVTKDLLPRLDAAK